MHGSNRESILTHNTPSKSVFSSVRFGSVPQNKNTHTKEKKIKINRTALTFNSPQDRKKKSEERRVESGERDEYPKILVLFNCTKI
jgi:hypothetical protein